MEKRKIIVVSSTTQSQVAFESDATTLGQLKSELDNRGVDYSGMTFLEGHSKLEMNLDDAVLPSNIPYRGGVTNDLVFLLTSPQKKIKSGNISRVELYGFIRDNDLADKIKEKFGKNFTNVGTDALADFIEVLREHLNGEKEEEQQKQCSNTTNNCSCRSDYEGVNNDEDEDDDDDEKGEETEKDMLLDNLVNSLNNLLQALSHLGLINYSEVTRSKKLVSDEEMRNLFGDFFA